MRPTKFPFVVLPVFAGCAAAPEPAATVHERLGLAPGADWQEIGRSVEDRPIRMRVVGRGERRVLWVGGIHGNEREGSHATAELANAFRADRELVENVTLVILDDLNPDGSAADARGNARGVDLNRNFPARNRRPGSEPLTEPEARVLHDVILRLEPHLVIVAHSWGRKATGPHQFINFDGPAEALARRFEAHASDYVVQPSSGIAPTPGSLGSWVGVDMGIPILTLEYARGRDPFEAWRETRAAILAVIRG